MPPETGDIASAHLNNLIKDCFLLSQACYEQEPGTFLQHKQYHMKTSILEGEGRYIVAYTSNIFHEATDEKKYVIFAVRANNLGILPAIGSWESQLHGSWYDRSKEVYPVVQDKVSQGYIPIFTGISLGGAVAQILLYCHIQDSLQGFSGSSYAWPRAVTFAAPSPFRPDLAEEIISSGYSSLIFNFYIGTNILPSSSSAFHDFVLDDGTEENDILEEIIRYKPVGVNVHLPSDDLNPLENRMLPTLSRSLLTFLCIFHSAVVCDACKALAIIGTRYCCRNCDDYDLCELCYNQDCHDTTHSFLKFEEVGSPPTEEDGGDGDIMIDETVMEMFELYTEEKDYQKVPAVSDCNLTPCTIVFNFLVADEDVAEAVTEKFCEAWIEDFKNDLEEDGISGSIVDETIHMKAVVSDAIAKFYNIVHRYSHRNPAYDISGDKKEFLGQFRLAAWRWASNESVEKVRISISEKIQEIGNQNEAAIKSRTDHRRKVALKVGKVILKGAAQFALQALGG